jgi:adenosine kinase
MGEHTVNSNYKIAILGPIPRDHITTYREEVIEKHGGIMHPTIALSVLMGNVAKIIPVTHVRNIDYTPIINILQKYPNVDTSHITHTSDQGDIIRLRFLDQNKRLEKQSGFMDPIIPEDVKNLLDCNAFVFLPVTDFEIALNTLKFIKKYSNGLVVFDAHGPTNVMTALGDRLMKFWVDRDLWLPYIDILKMNLEEAKCTWFKKKYTLQELENDYEFDRSELPAFAEHCINMGVKALYVTLDEKGCLAYFKKDNRIEETYIPAIKVSNVVDTTGCGDSFAGGLAYGLLAKGDYIKATYYGNALGAQRTQGKTFDVFKPMAETEKMIKETYGN